MTVSADGPATASGKQPFEAGWRERRAREQQAALPGGSIALCCSAPLGTGGLGRHAQEIAAAHERRGGTTSCLCGPLAGGRSLTARARAEITRRSAPWRMWNASVSFDAAAAGALPRAEHLIAFSGQALRQLQAARRSGFGSVALVSPTGHLRQVAGRYEAACRRHPLESPWTRRILRRSLAEYELAERIYVSSRYVWESFVQEGFPEEALQMLPLTPDPRFAPGSSPPPGAVFEVLYVGSLSVVKGVPLLVEAMRAIAATDLRLVLCGGWESRGMRRYLERACATDPRIEIRRGDPLPSMRSARLYVHPSYEDGFSYASAEALACGVPAIVSENTGMKELIDPGRTGIVLPTGDLDALTETISTAYRGELLHD